MRRPLLLILGLLSLALATQCAAAQPVEIQAADGRVLRGAVDARTDDSHLWVRQEEGSVILATSLAWGDVATIRRDGQAVDAAALRQNRSKYTSKGAAVTGEYSSEPSFTSAPVGQLNGPTGSNTQSQRIRSLEIVNVCVVNLDRDVEPDGLSISIAALDSRGEPVAVRGNLSARLFGESRAASVATVEFGVLDDWSERVAPTDFVDGVATYEFRFRRTAPEWQFDLLPDAVLEVRLGAYGHGNFAASAPVLIRPFNPLRDNRQLLQETRFMPHELHGRNPASSVAPRSGLWLHWTR